MIDPAILFLAGAALTGAAAVRGRAFFRLRWRPDRRVAAALGTGLLAGALSALGRVLPDAVTYGPLMWLGIFGVCGFVLPWAWVLFAEQGSVADLGLRREGAGRSLLLSGALAALLAFRIGQEVELARFETRELLVAAFSLNVGGLFELFLYFGFLHPRLRDAFGPLPAILGTAAVYVLWHLGTELPMHKDPWAAAGMLFVVGVGAQALFAITDNGLVYWPLFFTAGVMHDFLVNLDLPQQVATTLSWPLLGWILAVGVPLGLHALARRGHRPRGGGAAPGGAV